MIYTKNTGLEGRVGLEARVYKATVYQRFRLSQKTMDCTWSFKSLLIGNCLLLFFKKVISTEHC